jgi:hypothetical protein
MTDQKNRNRPPDEEPDLGPPEYAPEMESAMGGTSDAGTAADDAGEAASFDRGLPDDETRRTSRSNQTPGAKTSADEGTRGTSGGTTPPDEYSTP